VRGFLLAEVQSATEKINHCRDTVRLLQVNYSAVQYAKKSETETNLPPFHQSIVMAVTVLRSQYWRGDRHAVTRNVSRSMIAGCGCIGVAQNSLMCLHRQCEYSPTGDFGLHDAFRFSSSLLALPSLLHRPPHSGRFLQNVSLATPSLAPGPWASTAEMAEL
jgi:hypothetical protein